MIVTKTKPIKQTECNHMLILVGFNYCTALYKTHLSK